MCTHLFAESCFYFLILNILLKKAKKYFKKVHELPKKRRINSIGSGLLAIANSVRINIFGLNSRSDNQSLFHLISKKLKYGMVRIFLIRIDPDFYFAQKNRHSV
jgi:hypothetical protein